MFTEKQRKDAEIPSASLADIAFLLLVFFLLVTTIDIDTGIGLVLPPDTDQPPPEVLERNMMKILVNDRGDISIEGELTSLPQVKQKVMEFVDNKGEKPNLSESPDKAIVSIKTERNTRYSDYINMLDEVVGAYDELRNSTARARFGKEYESLDKQGKEYQTIKNLYPKKISVAEPDQE